jgi:acetolactate synthase-1/2/3 large subunit
MAASPGAGQRIAVDTAADALIEALRASGIEVIFANLGTDHPSLIETFAKFRALGRPAPRVLLCPHEIAALSAAHGFAQATGRPQALIIHVDAGTANLGGAVHNAARTRVPVFILAGRTPFTDRGELPGSRDTYVQFLQDVYDQAGIVRPYVKWEYELHRGANIGRIVQRALRLAVSDPPGPVYLTAPRETLEEPVEFVELDDPARSSSPRPAVPDRATLREIAQSLCEAERPIAVTSYLGRNPGAVAALVQLADHLALPVLEMLPRSYMNFPTDHPLYLSVGESVLLDDADLVLILDCDVPWIPTEAQPPASARIIHLDMDPVKADLPLWMFPAHFSARVDSAATLPALLEDVNGCRTTAVAERVRSRRQAVERQVRTVREEWRVLASPPARGAPMTAAYLSAQLGGLLPPETSIVSELVSNAAASARYLPRSVPGSYFASGGASLGWGLGASIGVKLARPDAEVVCLVGDGSFLFGVPSAVLWMAQHYGAPFLSVVYNNRGWNAAKSAIVRQHPEGYAVKHGEFLSSFGEGVDFATLARAAGGHGERVLSAGDLPAAVGRAREAVRQGKPAVLDVLIAPVGGSDR